MASSELSSIVNETDYLPCTIHHFSNCKSGNTVESYGRPSTTMFVHFPFISETEWQKTMDLLNLEMSNMEDLQYFFEKKGPITCELQILKDCLHELESSSQDGFVLEDFFHKTLRLMQKAVTEMPRIFNNGLPKLGNLNKEDNLIQSVTLTRWQLFCLMSAAFFNLFDGQSAGFSLFNLMSTNFLKKDVNSRKEKLKCCINYFHRFTDPDMKVTFLRKCTIKHHVPSWSSSKMELPNIRVFTTKIQENEHQATLVDFANKQFGGGLLGCGTVQEEILISEHPECMVGMLLCEDSFEENEALLIVGAKKVNNTVGYGSSFKWAGTSCIKIEEDKIYNRYKSSIVAIDALDFTSNQQLNEYSEQAINRELLKAFTGFRTTSEKAPPIATGKWGCGVFGGNVQMKIILQIIAAAESHREIHFHFFGDSENTRTDLYKLIVSMQRKSLKIGKLYTMVLQYRFSRGNATLYEYIMNQLNAL